MVAEICYVFIDSLCVGVLGCGQVKMALDNGNHHAKFPMMSHMLKIAYGSEPAKKVLPCEW